LHANNLGFFLTLGLPGLTFALYSAGWSDLGLLLPPGSVYEPLNNSPSFPWLVGLLAAALVTLLVARQGLTHCDRELRLWYEAHHGRKLLD